MKVNKFFKKQYYKYMRNFTDSYFMAIYKGFSTVDADKTHKITLQDIELVKRDLMNHFMSRVGENRMRPTWGCRIWDYQFEMSNTDNYQAIYDEVSRVVNSDPRCQLTSADMTTTEYGVQVSATILFKYVDIIDTMFVDFDTRTSTLFGTTTLS